MSKYISKIAFLVISSVFIIVGCNESNNPTEPTSQINNVLNKKGFIHGIVINIDGEDYYFAGAPDGPEGAFDIPGHDWVMAGSDQVIGKHYNTGPFGAPQWWSSDAPDGEFLYEVHGIIDTWSMDKAKSYAERGYVHRHEFVRVSDLEPHPSKVIWFKHTARTSFTLDRGPMGQGGMTPPYIHDVTPGVDYKFPNNGMMPYPEL
ncbi:MAG: hypothetical protein ABFS12_15065 [Bacteroidota bacterium]